MTKTKETLQLENALDAQSRSKREYGCTEVTIGFAHDGHGDEIVDYMTMDSQSIFKCYEIKVTLSDLKTDNKKSFYGDYNYLVVSASLYHRQPVWENYIPPYAGILVGEGLVVKKEAKKRPITQETREMLKDSLIRSVFWKMENYKDASDTDIYRSLQKELETEKQQHLETAQMNERMLWTYQDYECWYQKNHQDPSFTIENGAKQQREEYQKRSHRELLWKMSDEGWVCPACGCRCLKNVQGEDVLSSYCPNCGADLRSL